MLKHWEGIRGAMKLPLHVALKKNTKETHKQDLRVVQVLRQSTPSVFLAPKVSYY